MLRCIVLVLAVLVTACCITFALGESDGFLNFSSNLTDIFDQSAKNWISSSENRAMFSVLISCDLAVSVENGNDYLPDFSKKSYVGKEGLDLVLIAHTQGDETIIVVYRPSSGEASFRTMDIDNDTLLELMLSNLCSDGYYKNDTEDILATTEALSDIFKN